VSKYLGFGLKCLYKALQDCPSAQLSVSYEQLQEIGKRVGEQYGEELSGCCIVTDGSLHALEADEFAKQNFFYAESHPDYNGWKGQYCKKGLYFFAFDGCIAWSCVMVPGSWHDGLILDRATDFLLSLPEGCWILGDSAFRVIPGRVERGRKEGEKLPIDPVRHSFILAVERLSAVLRLSSEWGIKDLKHCWEIFSNPLPADDIQTMKLIWFDTMMLHNLRVREMQVSQMLNSLLSQ
jgi:hypothetical protein